MAKTGGLRADFIATVFMLSAKFDGDAGLMVILAAVLRERLGAAGCYNCASFTGMKLQIPAGRYRCHYEGQGSAPGCIHGISKPCMGCAIWPNYGTTRKIADVIVWNKDNRIIGTGIDSWKIAMRQEFRGRDQSARLSTGSLPGRTRIPRFGPA
jgi:hypothetical protein